VTARDDGARGEARDEASAGRVARRGREASTTLPLTIFCGGWYYCERVGGEARRCRYMPHLLEHLRAGRVDAKPVFTHRLPFERAPERYRTFAQKRDGCIKVALFKKGTIHYRRGEPMPPVYGTAVPPRRDT
jgi:hypothetical protein